MDRHKTKDVAAEPTPQRRRKLRRKVEALFAGNPRKTWWFSTLADKTNADLKDLVAVCERLMKEGKIHVQHPSHQSRKMKGGA